MRGGLSGACSGAAVYGAGGQPCMIARAPADLACKRSCICAGESAVACPIDAVAAAGREERPQSPSCAPGARLHRVTPHSRIPEPDHLARRRATAPPANGTPGRAHPSPLEPLGWPPSPFPLPEPNGTRRPFTAQHPAALRHSEEPSPGPSRADPRSIDNGRFRAKLLWRGQAKPTFPRPPLGGSRSTSSERAAVDLRA